MNIDSAVRLVPRGWDWLVRTDDDGGYANVYLRHDEVSDKKKFQIVAATPAQALKIAALKARRFLSKKPRAGR